MRLLAATVLTITQNRLQLLLVALQEECLCLFNAMLLDMQESTTLRLRRQALLLKSDLNRLTLDAECQRLRQAVSSWSSSFSLCPAGCMPNRELQRVGPMALMLAPLAGVALGTGFRRSSAGAGFFAWALKAAPVLIRLWRACVSPSNVAQ